MQWGRAFPTEERSQDLVKRIVDEVQQDAKITIYLRAEVIDAQGCVGDFQLQVEQRLRGADQAHSSAETQCKPSRLRIQTGAFLLATGFDPYEPQTGEFGYAKHPEVITLPQKSRWHVRCRRTLSTRAARNCAPS